MNKENFTRRILKWYDKEQRILPWRDNPNPYYVWVSEIMLQQTRVEAVIPYFNHFIEKLPTIKDLANVEDNVLLKLWEGLGYYNRARNLKKTANIIVTKYNGIIPSSTDDLITLPGIGPYTSGAIASIAFNKSVPAVDGNVYRVFARLLHITKTIKDKEVKLQIQTKVKNLLPNQRISDFNQALMELGAKVCLPNGAPLCGICPVNSICISYQYNDQNNIPIKQPKKKKKEKDVTVFLLEYNNEIVIEKREDTLLNGLFQFPNIEKKLTLKEVQNLYPKDTVTKIGSTTHIFTHLKWNLTGFHIKQQSKGKTMYVKKDELLSNYPIPTAFSYYKNYYIKENSWIKKEY